MNLHILFITARADIGGGPKHLSDLLKGIKKIRPDINISVAAPNQKPFASEFKSLSTFFIPLPPRSFSFISFLKLLYFCITHEVQIIHSHGRGAGLYSRLLGLFPFKIIHTLHGLHLEQSLVGKIKTFIDKILSPLSDIHIHVSHDEKERAHLLGMIPKKTIVIQNGVDIAMIKEEFNKIEKKEARDYFNLPNDKIILGALARHDYAKGIDLLIELANRGVAENYLFVVAGDGELLSKHNAMINNPSVLLLGKTHEPIKFLRSIDVFISFSRSEGLPLAVLEALSCEIPCLLSEVTGNLALHEFSHFFKQHNDLSFWQNLSALKTKNLDKFKEEFNSKMMIEKTINLYVL